MLRRSSASGRHRTRVSKRAQLEAGGRPDGSFEYISPSCAAITGYGVAAFAQAIHDRSPRRARPLVTLNCAAIPSSLVESELFGHEKGAFTGAHAQRRGRFETADGSTLFLDEIGDLPLELQGKLLRAIQDGTFERVGGESGHASVGPTSRPADDGAGIPPVAPRSPCRLAGGGVVV